MTHSPGQTEHIWVLHLVLGMLLSNLWSEYCCLILSTLGDRELITSLCCFPSQLWAGADHKEYL